MYCYIYDTFVNQQKYNKQLLKMELLLTDLGIGGKIYRLNALKNIEEIINQAMEEGAETIVAVGDDRTASKIINFIINKKLTLGMIPMGGETLLARAMGISSVEEAIRILSARKINHLDVGRANDQYFLLGLETNDSNVVFNFKNYQIQPRNNNEVAGLYNLNISQYPLDTSPGDGIMEAVFVPRKRSGWINSWRKKTTTAEKISIFPVREVIIEHQKKPVTIQVDRERVVKTPVEVTVLKNKLRVIVGKEAGNKI